LVSSMDSGRNLDVAWVGRSSTPTQRQVFVSAATAASKWKKWSAPVQVSDGLAATGDQVNVFPWTQAGGPGRVDTVWYGDSSNLDPSDTATGHVWNVFMNQLVFPTNPNGSLQTDAGGTPLPPPTQQLVK